MKKKLRIEELRVDTFVVAKQDGARGTVRAHEISAPNQCASGVWSCLESCEDTCGLTCWNSCWGTCDSCGVDTCNCA
ncbi:MAG TPA: hypothetical protein VF771_06350 [Longimicrobiaceae bacterium]